jgi:DNA-binding NarL/FixJ family response regulator
MTAPRRILIADDHAIFREGLAMVLTSHPGLRVTAEAATGREAVAKAVELKPDLIIMDISMPELSGLEATKEIVTRLPGARIIILSVHSRKTFIMEALKAGARGYVIKDAVAQKLLEAVETVLKGECFLDSPAASHIVAEFVRLAAGRAEPAGPGRLTDREAEVLRLLVEGLSTRQIAARLFISPKTVDNHRANLMAKLGCHDLIDLVKYALANGLVDPEAWSR